VVNSSRIALRLIALSGMLAAGAAQATATRTFVSVGGSDANACSVAAPCRTFARAAAATSSNGEIVVLDSGGYGPVTITQSLAITAPPGIYAGISVPSGNNNHRQQHDQLHSRLTLASRSGGHGASIHDHSCQLPVQSESESGRDSVCCDSHQSP